MTKSLQAWGKQSQRKPLILKGVRQTGKTYLLKQFGETDFAACHYLNFEHQPKATDLFAKGFEPKRILQDLAFLLGAPIRIGKDLLIFDEIQACPPALTSLKYFAEFLPELHLCCAGSLLGLHLGETSFPVGKVDFFHLHPMCFAEFLEADGDVLAVEYLNTYTQQTETSDIIHAHLWEQFKIYLITGGLPEVVQTYLDHKTDLYTALMLVRKRQRDIIQGYYADIAKHSGKINAMHIDRVWRAVPSQLAQAEDISAKRFQFTGIIPGIDRYQRLVNVLDWLVAAELVIKVFIVEHVELPLMAYVEEARFKLYLFDVGILGALSDLPPQAILAYDYGTYKGYFAENFVAQEFVVKEATPLYSWQENRAEIEFLYQVDNQIIPVEVKAGRVMRNQSLNKYANKYNPPYRAVLGAKPPHVDLENHYQRYPLYMAYWFPICSSKK